MGDWFYFAKQRRLTSGCFVFMWISVKSKFDIELAVSQNSHTIYMTYSCKSSAIKLSIWLENQLNLLVDAVYKVHYNCIEKMCAKSNRLAGAHTLFFFVSFFLTFFLHYSSLSPNFCLLSRIECLAHHFSNKMAINQSYTFTEIK